MTPEQRAELLTTQARLRRMILVVAKDAIAIHAWTETV
jgi:hypothetical protein